MSNPFNELPLPTQAGILCNEEQFRTFAATKEIGEGARFGVSAAAEFIRRSCNIKSRADLATDTTAADKFAKLRTEYDAWRGRIAQPRDG